MGEHRANGLAPTPEVPPMQPKRNHPGIRVRHSRSCATNNGGVCRCAVYYEAAVYSKREQKKIRRTFHNLAEAKAWRAEATTGVARGTLRTPTKQTLREAAEEWIEKAKTGEVLTRSGAPYKPSALRGYEASLTNRILPELGARRLSEIHRHDVQDLADRLRRDGWDPSTVRNTLLPLRAIYRRAISRSVVTVNPTTGLELPTVKGRRERIASPDEAARLLAALPEEERPLWATALYAGLRRGELMALHVDDVDLKAGLIRVRRSWDEREGYITPKSRKGTRVVPIPSVLRGHLQAQILRTGRRGGDLVFGVTPTKPFLSGAIAERALRAWAATCVGAFIRGESIDVEPIGLHECRHTFASLMIAAGVNVGALADYMGHASVTITLDRYRHLLPGNENEAARLLDEYLERASGS